MRLPLQNAVRLGLALAAFAITSLAAPPDKVADEQVRKTMAAIGEAMTSKNVAVLDGLLTDDLTYSHSTGKTQTKAELLHDLSVRDPYKDVKFSDVSVRVTARTAVVSCVNDYLAPSTQGGMKQNHLKLLMVFIRDDKGNWRLTARQGTNIVP